MPAMTLAKSGKRYTHEEWIGMSNDERDEILRKHGPAYTDEAWKNHFGRQNSNRKPR
jgi:hypothetical protein